MSIVKLYLNKDYSVRQLQETFAAMYQFLRINFYCEPASGHSHAFHCTVFSPKVRMLDLNPGFHNGDLEIADDMKVVDLENILYRQFGLHAHISRRSGNLWMETSRNNTWTLKQQNDHGEALSSDPANSKILYYRDIPYGC